MLEILPSDDNAKVLIGGITFGKGKRSDMRIFRALPSLAAVQTFLICAELGSMKKASAVLHRSQGAISKQIKQLEEFYDVKLFERSVDGLMLSNQGHHFVTVSKDVMAAVGRYDASPLAADGPIKITVPSTFALRWLLPRLEGIRKLIAGEMIEVRSTHQDVGEIADQPLELMIARTVHCRKERSGPNSFQRCLRQCAPL